MEAKSDFAKAVNKILGSDIRDLWAVVPKIFSHNAFVVDLLVDQGI